MLFNHQIVTQRYKKYRSTGNYIFFPNMNTTYEIEIVYILKIVRTLNVQKIKSALEYLEQALYLSTSHQGIYNM